jgi:hypothetical protein
MYQETADYNYQVAADLLISQLLAGANRPGGASFYIRETGFDKCNGLIGQAWVIEALCAATVNLNRHDLLPVAEEVFLMHPQNNMTGLWKRVEIDGRTLSYDATFNHQLWFAAAGGMLLEAGTGSPEVRGRVRTFLNKLNRNLRLYDSGIIFHLIRGGNSPWQLMQLLASDVRGRVGLSLVRGYIKNKLGAWLRVKSEGYHPFNLYGFAILFQQFPDHKFWTSIEWQSAASVIHDEEKIDAMWASPYGSGYNPVGFELAFMMQVFNIGTPAEKSRLVSEQLRRHIDLETGRLIKRTPDGATLTARLYEATRLEFDMELELVS